MNITELPTLDAVAIKLSEILQQDHEAIVIEELIETIAFDVAISANILRYANAPVNGFARQIETVKDAVTLLGMQPTATLALSFKLTAAFPLHKTNALDYKLFWRRSILSALAGREIANCLLRDQRDTVFIASLLQDIGILVFDRTYEDKYASIIAGLQSEHIMLAQAEVRSYGENHAAVGARLLEEWGLPVSIYEAVSNSHNMEKHSDSLLNDCVAVSGWFADVWLFGDEHSHNKYLAQALGSRLLPLNDRQVAAIIDNTNTAIMDVLDIFPSVDLKPLQEEEVAKTQYIAKELFQKWHETNLK